MSATLQAQQPPWPKVTPAMGSERSQFQREQTAGRWLVTAIVDGARAIIARLRIYARSFSACGAGARTKGLRARKHRW